jgi:putative DNA primase/helicase
MDNTDVSNMDSTQEPNKGVDENETDTKSELNLTKYVDGKLVKLNKAEMIEATSNFLLKEYKFITFRDNKDCFYYDEQEGIYKCADPFIEERVLDYLDEDANINMINEIANKIKIRRYIDRDLVETDKKYICLENGVFNIDTNEFIDHTPDLIFFSKIPVKYDPIATCPEIDAFFNSLFFDNGGIIKIVEELFGYCLLRSYPLHKAIMLYGSGGTGKTTFMSLLRKFLGESNTCSVSLQDIVYNRFAAHQLHGKLANIFDDLSDIKLRFVGPFQMATGQSKIRADRKHRSAIEFYNHSKLIFSCNTLPDVQTDDPFAFFRRWIIINFKNNLIRDGNAVPDKISELIAPEELSGLLNKALAGLKRLLDNQEFTYSEDVEDVKNYWMREANNVERFVQEMCIVDAQPDSKVDKDDLFADYVDFCNDNDCVPKAKNIFGNELKRLLGSKIRTGRASTDARKRIWVGIRLNIEGEIKKGPMDEFT